MTRPPWAAATPVGGRVFSYTGRMSDQDEGAPRDAWPHLHLWQIQPLRDLLVLAAVLGLIYLGYVLSIVTVPILLALTLAYLFEPLVRRMTERRGIGRARVAASILVLSGILVVVPVAIGMTYSVMQGVRYVQAVIRSIDLVSQSVRAPDREDLRLQVQIRSNAWLMIRNYIVQEREKAAAAAAREQAAAIEAQSPRPANSPPLVVEPDSSEEPSDLFRLLEFTREFLQQHSTELGRNLLQAGGGAVGAVFSIVSSGVKFVTIIALTAFFFFFFCTGYGQVLAFWEGLLPEQKKGRVLELASKMDAVISGFIRGRLIICAMMIGVYTVGYALIGAPAAWIAGLVVGALTLVPYAAAATAPVIMLLMWLEPGEGWQASWWWTIGSPLAVMGVAQILDDYVLTPRIQGKATNMDTPTILFASIAGGSLAGFYGLLLAIPIGACIKILLKEVFWPRVRDWATGKAEDVLPISKR